MPATDFSLTVAMSRVDAVKEAVEKENRRLNKYGLPEISYEISEPYVYKDDLRPWGIEVRKFSFVLPGDMVTLIPGYDLIAIIDRKNDLITVLDNTVNFADIEFFRHRDICDHCGTKRVRKAYLIIRKAGEKALMAVGTTCADAYLGIDITKNICNAATIWQRVVALDPEFCLGEPGSRADRVYNLTDAVASTLASIREFGYCSNGNAVDFWQATSGSAMMTCNAHLMGIGKTTSLGVTEKAPTKDDFRNAEKCIEWVRKTYVGDSTFACNVQSVFSRDYMTAKGFSFVAYPVHKFLVDSVKSDTSSSDFIGNPGDRMKNISLTVTGAHGYESMYGCGVLYTFTDDSGNCIVWSTTSGNSMEIGQKIIATFTIKEHGEFRGTKQTKVTRLRVM